MINSFTTGNRPKVATPFKAVALVALGSLALAGCSAGTSTPSTSGAGPSGKAPVSQGASQIKVSLTNSGGKDQCALDYTDVESGPTTFTTQNIDASSLSEVELLSQKRILGERENLAPGLSAGTFSVTLDPGTYQIYCPGADPEQVALTVTGERATSTDSSTSALLATGAQGYSQYVAGQSESLLDAVKELQKAVDADDVSAAQRAYAKARPFYERIEPVAESFPDLDPAIDLREADLAPGDTWTGFHPIEKDLFVAKKITPDTQKQAAQLVKEVQKLVDETKTLEYKPEELANGASSLLEEVQSSKITGEEENFSHIDLVDFVANVEGSEQAFLYLKPALEKIDPELTTSISSQFDKVDALLKNYRDPQELGGYKRYDEALRKSDAPTLTAAIQDLQAPLAKLAEKVATAN